MFAHQNFEQNNRTPGDKTQGRLLAQAAVGLAADVFALAAEQTGDRNMVDDLATYQALTSLQEHVVLDGLLTVDYSNGRRALQVLQVRQVVDWMDFAIIEDFVPFSSLQMLD